MTKQELIELIGDRLEEIDTLRGSLLPGVPKRVTLDGERDELDSQQLKLLKGIWDDNTQQFQNAATELSDVNSDLKQTVADLKKFDETLQTLQRFTAAVDKIVKIVLP